MSERKRGRNPKKNVFILPPHILRELGINLPLVLGKCDDPTTPEENSDDRSIASKTNDDKIELKKGKSSARKTTRVTKPKKTFCSEGKSSKKIETKDFTPESSQILQNLTDHLEIEVEALVSDKYLEENPNLSYLNDDILSDIDEAYSSDNDNRENESSRRELLVDIETKKHNKKDPVDSQFVETSNNKTVIENIVKDFVKTSSQIASNELTNSVQLPHFSCIFKSYNQFTHSMYEIDSITPTSLNVKDSNCSHETSKAYLPCVKNSANSFFPAVPSEVSVLDGSIISHDIKSFENVQILEYDGSYKCPHMSPEHNNSYEKYNPNKSLGERNSFVSKISDYSNFGDCLDHETLSNNINNIRISNELNNSAGKLSDSNEKQQDIKNTYVDYKKLIKKPLEIEKDLDMKTNLNQRERNCSLKETKEHIEMSHNILDKDGDPNCTILEIPASDLNRHNCSSNKREITNQGHTENEKLLLKTKESSTSVLDLSVQNEGPFKEAKKNIVKYRDIKLLAHYLEIALHKKEKLKNKNRLNRQPKIEHEKKPKIIGCKNEIKIFYTHESDNEYNNSNNSEISFVSDNNLILHNPYFGKLNEYSLWIPSDDLTQTVFRMTEANTKTICKKENRYESNKISPIKQNDSVYGKSNDLPSGSNNIYSFNRCYSEDIVKENAEDHLGQELSTQVHDTLSNNLGEYVNIPKESFSCTTFIEHSLTSQCETFNHLVDSDSIDNVKAAFTLLELRNNLNVNGDIKSENSYSKNKEIHYNHHTNELNIFSLQNIPTVTAETDAQYSPQNAVVSGYNTLELPENSFFNTSIEITDGIVSDSHIVSLNETDLLTSSIEKSSNTKEILTGLEDIEDVSIDTNFVNALCDEGDNEAISSQNIKNANHNFTLLNIVSENYNINSLENSNIFWISQDSKNKEQTQENLQGSPDKQTISYNEINLGSLGSTPKRSEDKHEINVKSLNRATNEKLIKLNLQNDNNECASSQKDNDLSPIITKNNQTSEKEFVTDVEISSTPKKTKSSPEVGKGNIKFAKKENNFKETDVNTKLLLIVNERETLTKTDEMSDSKPGQQIDFQMSSLSIRESKTVESCEQEIVGRKRKKLRKSVMANSSSSIGDPIESKKSRIDHGNYKPSNSTANCSSMDNEAKHIHNVEKPKLTKMDDEKYKNRKIDEHLMNKTYENVTKTVESIQKKLEVINKAVDTHSYPPQKRGCGKTKSNKCYSIDDNIDCAIPNPEYEFSPKNKKNHVAKDQDLQIKEEECITDVITSSKGIPTTSAEVTMTIDNAVFEKKKNSAGDFGTNNKATSGETEPLTPFSKIIDQCEAFVKFNDMTDNKSEMLVENSSNIQGTGCEILNIPISNSNIVEHLKDSEQKIVRRKSGRPKKSVVAESPCSTDHATKPYDVSSSNASITSYQNNNTHKCDSDRSSGDVADKNIVRRKSGRSRKSVVAESPCSTDHATKANHVSSSIVSITNNQNNNSHKFDSDGSSFDAADRNVRRKSGRSRKSEVAESPCSIDHATKANHVRSSIVSITDNQNNNSHKFDSDGSSFDAADKNIVRRKSGRSRKSVVAESPCSLDHATKANHVSSSIVSITDNQNNNSHKCDSDGSSFDAADKNNVRRKSGRSRKSVVAKSPCSTDHATKSNDVISCNMIITDNQNVNTYKCDSDRSLFDVADVNVRNLERPKRKRKKLMINSDDDIEDEEPLQRIKSRKLYLSRTISSDGTDQNSTIKELSMNESIERLDEMITTLDDHIPTQKKYGRGRPKSTAVCGVCKKEIVGVHAWFKHAAEHDYLVWMEGNESLDLNNEQELVKTLKYMKKYVGEFKCRKCGLVRVSAVGFLSHIRQCDGTLVNKPFLGNLSCSDKKKGLCKCGVCGEMIEDKQWLTHMQMRHYYLAWRDGEFPLDFEKPTEVYNHLTRVLKKISKLTCECGSSRSSALGFQAHVLREHGINISNVGVKAETSLDNLVSNFYEEPRTSTVKCSVCSTEMNASEWKMHALNVHHNIAWFEGGTPIDIRDMKLCGKILQEIFNITGRLKCNKCEEERLSAMGFYAHILICGRNKEELEKVKLACLNCKEHYLPTVLSRHELSCKTQIQETPKEEPVFDGSKRRAALRAQETFEKIDKIEAQNEDSNGDFSNCSESDYTVNESEEEEEFLAENKLELVLKVAPNELDYDAPKKRLRVDNKDVDSPLLNTRLEDRENLEKEMKNIINGACSEVPLFIELKCKQFIRLAKSDYDPYLPTLKESAQATIRHGLERKKFKLFESDCGVDDSAIFVGGPVTCMAWMPTSNPKNAQYLAIATRKSPNAEGVIAGDCTVENTIIQLWKFDDILNLNVQSISLSCGICSDYGPIWAMDWCPSGGEIITDGQIERSALLAVCGSDGIVYIYAIGDLNDLRECDYPFYKTEPVAELRLFAGKNTRKMYQATAIHWSTLSGHTKILVGYGNGTVASFDLTANSPLNRKVDNGRTIFYAHFENASSRSIITGLTHLYDDVIGVCGLDGAWLLSGSRCIQQSSTPSLTMDKVPGWPAFYFFSDSGIQQSAFMCPWRGIRRVCNSSNIGSARRTGVIMVEPNRFNSMLYRHPLLYIATSDTFTNTCGVVPLSQEVIDSDEVQSYDKFIQAFQLSSKKSHKPFTSLDLPLTETTSIAICPANDQRIARAYKLGFVTLHNLQTNTILD